MAGDPHWSKVVLAMHMDGADGSTVFTDQKGNTVTPTGSAISTAQSKFGGASLYYDGVSAGSITVSSSPDLALSGDFTIEVWAKPATDCPTCHLLSNNTSFATNVWILEPTHATNPGKWCFFMMGIAVTGGPLVSTSNSLTNAWTHVAVTRNGSVFRMFVNGVLESTYISSTPLTVNTTEPLYLNGGAGRYKGYLDDVRITKGVARYTADFTPPVLAFPNGPAVISGTTKDSAGAFAPRAVRVYRKSDGALSGAVTSHSTTGAFAVPALDTTPHYAIAHDSDADPYWPNVVLATHFDTDSVPSDDIANPYQSSVVLHLHMDGANASTTFRDTSQYGRTVTAVGTAQISTAQSKFGGASAIFDGSSANKLTSAATSDFKIGGAPFTIEFWCYPTAANHNGGVLLGVGTSSTAFNSTGGRHYSISSEIDSSISFQFWNGTNSTWMSTAANSFPINAWNHFAASYDGASVRLFTNGVLQSTTGVSVVAPSDNPSLEIGSIPTMTAGSTYAYTGYIDELRITKGVARYTANFTPATLAFTNYHTTVLGLHMEGANASTVFQDVTGKTVTAVGNAQISTAQAKFGNSSALFDGTGDYLSYATSTSFDPGTGAFTVEGWYRFAVLPTAGTNASLAAKYNGTGNQRSWFFLFDNTGGVYTLKMVTSPDGTSATASTLTSSAITPIVGAWHHIAWVRETGVNRLFFDGVQVAYQTSAPAIFAGTAAMTFGASSDGAAQFINGNVDDIRITKGVARYTANFTPPTVPFSSFKDLTGKDLMVNGVPSISTATKKYGDGALYFDGTTDGLEITGVSLDADFTLEAFVWIDSTCIDFLLFCQDASEAGWVLVPRRSALSNKLRFYDYTLGAGFTSAATVSTDQWVHIAVVRKASVITVYVGGVSVGSILNTTVYSQTNWVVGKTNSSYLTTKGYVDDLRITKGIARYQTDFTPPERAFPGALGAGTSNALIFDDLTPD